MVSHYFRNDDINMNTNFFELDDIYNAIHDLFPKAEIWSCVTVFSRANKKGAIYPKVPFKNKPFEYFLEVDRVCDNYKPPKFVKVVSHGLWHLDHTDITTDLQEASIVTSCNLLGTSTFVPPFNHWNTDTEAICKKHDIQLIKSYENSKPNEFIWKSLEHNKFDDKYSKWYFHSWSWSREGLVKHLTEKVSR